MSYQSVVTHPPNPLTDPILVASKLRQDVLGHIRRQTTRGQHPAVQLTGIEVKPPRGNRRRNAALRKPALKGQAGGYSRLIFSHKATSPKTLRDYDYNNPLYKVFGLVALWENINLFASKRCVTKR